MADKPVSLWWKQQAEGECTIVIYTENMDATKKLKYEPSAYYSVKGKLYAVHYTCQENDQKYKTIFSLLGLTEEDEKKPERLRRRTKTEMQAAREQETTAQKGKKK